MRGSIIVAAVAAFPPTLAAVLGYLANSRNIRRSVGVPPGIPLAQVIERLEKKIDRLSDAQGTVRERLARLEGPRGRAVPRPRTAGEKSV
jgi:hypothetical protein